MLLNLCFFIIIFIFCRRALLNVAEVVKCQYRKKAIFTVSKTQSPEQKRWESFLDHITCRTWWILQVVASLHNIHNIVIDNCGDLLFHFVRISATRTTDARLRCKHGFATNDPFWEFNQHIKTYVELLRKMQKFGVKFQTARFLMCCCPHWS